MLRNRSTARPRYSPSRSPSFRPGCEPLEPRWAPATVTNLNDAGPGSLRQAILDTPPGEVVDFQKGLQGAITLTTGELAIRTDLTILGPAADVLAVSGNSRSRVFNISAGANVAIYGLTVRDGNTTAAGASGGGILNAGNLFLYGSHVVSNYAVSTNQPGLSGAASGGGIRNTGTLTIFFSTIGKNGVLAAPGVTGPTASASGGGIVNAGTLTVAYSWVSGNTAVANARLVSSGSGGGISNSGNLTVYQSIIDNNTASGTGGMDGGFVVGGGIDNRGTAVVVDSTISNNTAQSNGRNVGGGGISSVSEGDTAVSNSTISGNTATTGPLQGFAHGGGLVASGGGRLRITHTTVTNNSLSGVAAASLRGGGVSISGQGEVALRNTLVAVNRSREGPDFWGQVVSEGHNLVGDGSGSSGFGKTDLVGTSERPIDPLLGPLDYHGGATLIHALLAGSPARDAGDPTDAPEFDQRGEGYPRVVGDRIDIGAFEEQGGRGPAPGSSLPPRFISPVDIDPGALLLLETPARRVSFDGGSDLN